MPAAVRPKVVRRRGRRNVKIGVAAALVAGGIVGYVATRPEQPPTIGTDLAGWQRVTTEEPGDDHGFDWSVPAAAFRATAGETTPVVIVEADDSDADSAPVGDPIELGDGVEAWVDGEDGDRQIIIDWYEDDGTAVYVAAWDVPRSDLVAYADDLARGNVTAQGIEEPGGLPVADRGTLHSDPPVATTTYVQGEATLTIEVRDDIGWLENALDGRPGRALLPGTVPVGDTPFGSGTAVLSELGRGWVALWSTPDGLAVQVTATGPTAEATVRELLEGGHLVEVAA